MRKSYLSNYSDRVIGIGEAQKLNSEFIQRDSGESEWLPQHLMELEQQLQNRFSDEAIELLEQRIKQAEQEGKDQVLIPNVNTEVSVDDAKKLLNSLSDSNRKEAIETLEEPTVNLQKKKKDTLLIANNIDKAEFTKLILAKIMDSTSL
ncbi:hypothetical protein [Acinetobacter ursingii]|uniref:hypothetical protein n=1 Tax=Acinetobacter ursingii TaxID=108980 RepID=UPI00209132C9|nr:hypothetical protein [Acinetobacter ursingii]